MMDTIGKLLLGDPNARKLKRYQPMVSDINLLEEEVAPLSDEELGKRLQEKHNVKIARRTVTKYRKMLDIPSSSVRKAF